MAFVYMYSRRRWGWCRSIFLWHRFWCRRRRARPASVAVLRRRQRQPLPAPIGPGNSQFMPALGLGFGGRDFYGAIRTNSRTANPSSGDICARARIYRFRLGFPNLKFGSGINWLLVRCGLEFHWNSSRILVKLQSNSITKVQHSLSHGRSIA